MISLMIVDDEAIIRKGIKTSIDWSMYDVQIVGEANNGKIALEKALELKPDIVITDIRMPVMDGLKLAELLKEKLPNTKTVILTGYDDFSYAKQAVNLRVYEYLLKPVGADELVKLVMKLKKEIISERNQRAEMFSTHMLVKENLPFIQAKFITSLLNGQYDDPDFIFEKAGLLKLDLSGPKYQAAVIDIDDYLLITEGMSQKDKDSLKQSVLNIAEEVLEPHTRTHVCMGDFDYLIMLFNIDKKDKFHVLNICHEIQDCIKRYSKLSVTIGIGEVCDRIENVHQSYNQALNALKSKVYKGKGAIIHIDMLDDSEPSTPFLYPSEEEKELLGYLRSMSVDKVNHTIDRIFDQFTDFLTSYNNVKNICLRLIIMSISILEEMGINIEEAFGGKLEPYAEIQKYETIEDIRNWLKELLSRFISIMEDAKDKKYKSIVGVAMKYVQEHYSDDITLDVIAGIVYVTPNYFSRVFKQETGESFTEWLNKYRVEKAKSLLKDVSLRTYEIAEKVGYNDYKYFSYNFKRYTGYTPREYRKLSN